MKGIGLDLGGTKLSGAVFSRNGAFSSKQFIELSGRGGKEVASLIREMVLKILDEFQGEIRAIGMSIPGIYYSKTGHVWIPNIDGWEDYPLLEEMRSWLPAKEMRISIDSDRACYILGETWQGNAQRCNNAIFMAVGTGIGAGILVDGRILRGAHDIAGATGWLSLSSSFRPEYADCGDFEYHASGPGLVKVAKDLMAANKTYSGSLRQLNQESLTAKHIFTALEDEDPIARAVLDQAVGYWGRATANYVSLFNPEKIIFGGGVFGPAVRYIDQIYAEAVKWSQPISIRQVKFEPSSLGDDAGLMGAGYLALNDGLED